MDVKALAKGGMEEIILSVGWNSGICYMSKLKMFQALGP